MEKIALKEEFKKEYQDFISAAQQSEAIIGSSEYKLFKMKRQREQIDGEIRQLWEKIVVEYSLDKNKDYFIDGDGNINLVDRSKMPQQGAPNVGTGQNETDKKVEVASDEKAEEAPAQEVAVAEPAVADNKEGESIESLA